MLNIEKYKKEIIAFAKGKYSDLTLLQLFMADKTGINYKEILNTQVLDWLTEEYKELILDGVEKAYLSAVIKPFRNKVSRICLHKQEKLSYIIIFVDTLDDDEFYDCIELPKFENGTMYKGMESGKGYTLKELGL